MELVYHSGDEYVPSFESDSLEVLAYIRFSKCDVFHVSTCYPWKSPTRKFPTLTDGQRTISDTEQIIQYLMAKGYDLDQTLNPEEKAVSLAFKALISEKLQPALLYLQWMDGTSYVDFTRQWYATQLPFPLTLILPNMIFNSVKRKLSTAVSKVSATEMNSNVFVADGVNCLDIIAHQLGSKPFMCGSSPTSLDASVFAHLCLIIQQPLPGNNALWKHLYSHGNLVDYCKSIRQTFFPELTEAPYPSESVEDNRFLPSLKDPGTWAILGLGAVFLALQYWRYRVPETTTESLPSDVSIDDVDIS